MTPATREYVQERFNNQNQTVDVEPVGNGLMVLSRKQTAHTFTNLMEETGWYMAAFRQDENGPNEYVFMPVPEDA